MSPSSFHAKWRKGEEVWYPGLTTYGTRWPPPSSQHSRDVTTYGCQGLVGSQCVPYYSSAFSSLTPSLPLSPFFTTTCLFLSLQLQWASHCEETKNPLLIWEIQSRIRMCVCTLHVVELLFSRKSGGKEGKYVPERSPNSVLWRKEIGVSVCRRKEKERKLFVQF